MKRQIKQFLCTHTGTDTELLTYQEGSVLVTETIKRECLDCGKDLLPKHQNR